MTMKLCCAIGLVIGAVLAGTGMVQADIVLPMTTIGNPGNAKDQPYLDPDMYVGAVSYTYQISTYEITVAQYTDFLNHKAASDPYGLYHQDMGSGGSPSQGGPIIERGGGSGSYTYTTETGKEDQPVRYVSFYDGLRLANWMHNGQGGGQLIGFLSGTSWSGISRSILGKHRLRFSLGPLDPRTIDHSADPARIASNDSLPQKD